MDVTSFFARLLQPPREARPRKDPDDIGDFDAVWGSVKDTLEHPNERQIIKGITSTDVPAHLRHIVDALVYEANRTDEDTTGACLEYLLKNDLLAHLERLCEADRPHGIKAEVVKLNNNLVVLLSERFLVHNAVHRPLRRLLKSCVGDEEPNEMLDGTGRTFGAASATMSRADSHEENELEGDLVDLMCVLCSRMRAYPPLLLIFFHDKGWLQPHTSSGAPRPSDARAMSSTKSDTSQSAINQDPHFEFLLFSYLLRFVHREGRVGDLARAGLLFLFDIAFLTPSEEGADNLHDRSFDGEDPLRDARDSLGAFILDGEFAQVIAAGLGAIYSLLPSKLRVPTLANQAMAEDMSFASASGGMHLGAMTDREDELSEGLPVSTNVDVKNQLDLLLKLFGFLQDILHRCSSPVHHASASDSTVQAAHVLGVSISDATVEAIQASFLDNVLYPSILESSPDDGSSVAVLTYLDVILANLDDGPLLTAMLSFLMDTDDRREARKTASSGALNYFAEEGRFTLKDLILDNIRSPNDAAATAALQLFGTLASDHCRLSVKGLLTTIRDPTATTLSRPTIPSSAAGDPFLATTVSPVSMLPNPVNSTDVHLQEIELYGSLISRIDPLQTSAEMASGYAQYLSDMHAALEADHCFMSAHIPLAFEEEDEKAIVRIGAFQKDPYQHRMSPSDPIIVSTLECLGRFFCQTPDQNVALTGVLTALALCPNRSLAGWILYDNTADEPDPWAKRRKSVSSDSISDTSSDDLDAEPGPNEPDPFSARTAVDLPAIYQVLRDLVRQVNRFRLDIDDFDRLLAERRQGLLFADHLDEAMNVSMDVEPTAFGLPGPTQQSSIASPFPRKGRTAGLVGGLRSLLTPKRKASPSMPGQYRPGASTPSGQKDSARKMDSSPFKSHYDQTASFTLEASSSSPVASGPWSPAKQPRSSLPSSRPRSALSHGDSASLLSSDPGGVTGMTTDLSVVVEGGEVEEGPKTVTLSSVLDNCVILEEFLKEVVGVITARRALGIDQVGFV